MGLREMLLEDFGSALPIDGGFGRSAEEPIVITTACPKEAAVVQLQVARLLYGAAGWYWRAVERTSVDPDKGRVDKVTSEVKYVEGENLITEKRSLYFDTSIVDLPSDQQMQRPSVPIGFPANLNLPWQLGWFHHDGITDHESTDPGLGVSVAYSAPKAKITICAYDKGLGDDIERNPDILAATEFDCAVSDFELTNPGAALIREHEELGARVRVYEQGATYSVVFLSPFNKFFFKLRLTLAAGDEPFMVDCAWNTVAIFAYMTNKK